MITFIKVKLKVILSGGTQLMVNPNMITIVWMVYALLLTYLERMADAKQLIKIEIDALSELELNIFLMRFLMIITNDLI